MVHFKPRVPLLSPKPRIIEVAHQGLLALISCIHHWLGVFLEHWCRENKLNLQTWDSQIPILASLDSFEVMSTGQFLYGLPCPTTFSPV